MSGDQHLLVLSTAPTNFAGAATANAGTLSILSSLCGSVEFWSHEVPFRADELQASGVKLRMAGLRSDAYPTSDTIKFLAITEEMASRASEWLQSDLKNRVILYSTFLFPFCAAAESAAELLKCYGPRVRCIVTPAGSDIWQIAHQTPRLARRLLDSENVTHVVTYSERFAGEIRKITGTTRAISIIPPHIDVDNFVPFENTEDANAIRASLGIDRDTFVITHCSNHRPVKALRHVLEIAAAFRASTGTRTHLLLVGPVTTHLRAAIGLLGTFAQRKLPFTTAFADVLVTFLGLRDDTRTTQAIANVSINTSLHDSFNISLAEAMACGTPVLTTDPAGISDIIQKYACGLTIPFLKNPLNNEPTSFAEGASCLATGAAVEWLTRINRDHGFRAEIGRRARAAIIDHCSSVALEEKWCELLEY